MRFRAKMKDQQSVGQFAKLLGPMARLSKDVVVVISPESLAFVMNKTSTKELTRSDAHISIELRKDIFFQEYSLKGCRPLEPDGNRIVFKMMSKPLERTIYRDLTKGAKAISICLKEIDTKYFLSVELSIPCVTSTVRVRPVNHDFRVELIPYRDWHFFASPAPARAVDSSRVEIDNFGLFRAMVDNLKRLGSPIDFFIMKPHNEDPILKMKTRRGECFTVQIDVATRPIHVGQGLVDEREGVSYMKVRVNTNRLSAIWTGFRFSKIRGKLTIFHQRMMQFEILMEDIRLTLFLPHREQEMIC